MARTRLSAATILALAVRLRAATIEYVYVTDMPAYSALAPCAREALSENIQWLTYDACPEAVSELQSCVCTKNNNFASISSEVSASVSYECGSTASEDQSSAQRVLSAYCNPSKTFTFSTPTAVSVYITDIPEFEYLAPCARSALGYAVGTMTWSRCPSEPAALASCACMKNQNSLVVSQLINSEARYSCDGHTADISSAQAMFAAFCAMNDGTTKFPTPSSPPGDMTYYITDLPQYSSLAPCAASGLSYAVQSQLYSLCPAGPQALASCVCFKDGMPSDVSKALTSSVKWYCDSTATEDISSALSVFSYYCSAADGKVTPPGITNSVDQSNPSNTGGPRQTGGGGSFDDDDTPGDSDWWNGDSTQDDDDPTSLGGPSTGVIVGAVVGAFAGLVLLGAIIFLIIRKTRKDRQGQMQIPNGPPAPHVSPNNYYGKPELPNNTVSGPLPPPSPSPSTLKTTSPARVDDVSPVSAATGTTGSPPPPSNQAELDGQAAFLQAVPNRPELHGQSTNTPPPPPPPLPNAPELYGQGAPPVSRPELQGQGAMYPTIPPNMSELQGQGSQFHHPSPNRPELPGQYNYHPPQHPTYSQQQYQPQQHPQQQHHPQLHPQASWQAGPVPELHEMDGGHRPGGMEQR
ncbi:hypothetical protein VTH82DRAFT_7409 [Thermothelomyces myriococcoides]